MYTTPNQVYTASIPSRCTLIWDVLLKSEAMILVIKILSLLEQMGFAVVFRSAKTALVIEPAATVAAAGNDLPWFETKPSTSCFGIYAPHLLLVGKRDIVSCDDRKTGISINIKRSMR